MKQPPSPSWAAPSWPREIVPLPLDERLRPLHPRRLVERRPGQAFFVAPASCTLRPDLIAHLLPALASRPDVGVFYGDDAVLTRNGHLKAVHCKPAFNPALLMADDYVGFPLLIRASALAGAAPEFGLLNGSAAWFRFLLAALSAGTSIDRIPQTLIATPGIRPQAKPRARAAALNAWFKGLGTPLKVGPGLTPGTLELKRILADPPPVTLVVPTRQSRAEGAQAPHIVNLLDSLRRSTYPANRIRVLIGDDAEDDAIYRGRSDAFSVTRIDTRRPAGVPFNYAAKMNRLWRAAETDVMVLMNDDLVVGSPGWLEALLTFALDRGVGGVGGRLLFPSGRLQHAGMFGGIYDVAAHPWYDHDAQAPTYDDWALTQRDCSMVTGALFATRRAAMEAVDGFDESFSLDFNDVDLCLKMRMQGYRIVYTPFAEMVHHEKASRQANVAPGAQVSRFLRRWRDVLGDDPMYSPQLRIDTDVVAPRREATQWIPHSVPAAEGAG
ncbi:glycosyltransferase family 2 protein [Methylobacterium sp. sgz302541]|uniref:glycosyltransferase family 2 protein n=1 Tax=unclassified Methylobacterium TaxID=2615210 RepID=UPI003D34F99F